MKIFRNKIAGYLMAALFMGYFSSTVLFYHVHYIDGKKVVHSHLYVSGNAQTPGHTHTGAEIQFFQHIAAILFLAPAMLILAGIFRELSGKAVSAPRTVQSWHHCGFLPRRAPPAFI